MKAWAGRVARPYQEASRRGSVMIEFAIVVPLLMLIVIGGLDFGRFLYVYAAITNAAEEGASYGSTNPPTAVDWVAGVTAAALAEPAGLLPVLADADVTVVDTPSNDPEISGYVTVEVRSVFRLAIPSVFQYWGLPTTFNLRRTVIMPHTR